MTITLADCPSTEVTEVESVKAKVKEGIPLSKHCLIFACKDLENGHTVADDNTLSRGRNLPV